jgi:hypothetical protein
MLCCMERLTAASYRHSTRNSPPHSLVCKETPPFSLSPCVELSFYSFSLHYENSMYSRRIYKPFLRPTSLPTATGMSYSVSIGR